MYWNILSHDAPRIVIAEAVMKDEAYETLRGLCEENRIPLMYVKAGDVIGDETLFFEVLHPDRDYVPDMCHKLHESSRN